MHEKNNNCLVQQSVLRILGYDKNNVSLVKMAIKISDSQIL